jgi:hypothetical protein
MSIITKGLIGVEDLNVGSGTFTRSNSTGGTITLTKINLSSLGLSVGSGVITSFTVVTTTPVTAVSGAMLLVNATGGSRIVNLPAAASAGLGSVIAVKKTDASANTVTIAAAGGEKIDDGNTFLLSLQNEFTKLVSDGTQWWVIG